MRASRRSRPSCAVRNCHWNIWVLAWVFQNLRLIAASSLFAETHSSGAERRRSVAHGVSPGILSGNTPVVFR